MRLSDTIDIYAGGPGSGCKGPNCGRPDTGKEKSKRRFQGPEGAPPVQTNRTAQGLPYADPRTLRTMPPAWHRGDPEAAYHPPTQTPRENLQRYPTGQGYQRTHQELINKQVLEAGDKVILLKPFDYMNPSPPFNMKTYPMGHTATFLRFRPEVPAEPMKARLRFGRSRFEESVPSADIQLLEKGKGNTKLIDPQPAPARSTRQTYIAHDGTRVTILRPPRSDEDTPRMRRFASLRHPQWGKFNDMFGGEVQGLDNPNRRTNEYFAQTLKVRTALEQATQAKDEPEITRLKGLGTTVFVDRYLDKRQTVVTELRTGEYGNLFEANGHKQFTFKNMGMASQFLMNRYGITQALPRSRRKSE